jgi:hypothetical protein
MWDADMMHGCHCDSGYYGHNCALIRCPHGDDPFTTGDNNEVQELVCDADSGSFYLVYKGAVTKRIPFDATVAFISDRLNELETMPSYDYQPVILTSDKDDDQAVCASDGNRATVQIEFKQESGDVPMITYLKATPPLANTVNPPALTIVELVKGDKEDLKCGGRGLCDEASGSCTCSQYYQTGDGYGNEGTKGDCSFAITAIGACPGEIPCSGHGVCSGDPSYQCTCSEGWESGDCSERGCLSAPAWFSFPEAENKKQQAMECANNGWCDRSTGQCNCAAGFSGGSCQYMNCPGGTPSCSGHGQCLSMAQLAEVTELNGDATAYTYGAIPNNVKTWDFQSIHGCKCDPGFEGHDCSLRSCPTGDDFNTMYQNLEVQLIQCTALPQNSFKLKFRQFETKTLYGSSTLKEVLEALNALPSVGEVDGELIHVSNPHGTFFQTLVCDTCSTETTISSPNAIHFQSLELQSLELQSYYKFATGNTVPVVASQGDSGWPALPLGYVGAWSGIQGGSISIVSCVDWISNATADSYSVGNSNLDKCNQEFFGWHETEGCGCWVDTNSTQILFEVMATMTTTDLWGGYWTDSDGINHDPIENVDMYRVGTEREVADLDPCRCAEDGVSGSQYTGIHGCQKHDDDLNPFCYVADPVACEGSIPMSPKHSPSPPSLFSHPLLNC